jgi:hypothetical protein
MGIRCADYVTLLYPPTSDGYSVGIVCLRTKNHGVSSFQLQTEQVLPPQILPTEPIQVHNKHEVLETADRLLPFDAT